MYVWNFHKKLPGTVNGFKTFKKYYKLYKGYLTVFNLVTVQFSSIHFVSTCSATNCKESLNSPFAQLSALFLDVYIFVFLKD
jgi:hypothetical protein